MEIGMDFIGIGRTSITIKCLVRNLFTRKTIISIDRLVFVRVDNDEKPYPHGLTIEDIAKKTG